MALSTSTNGSIESQTKTQSPQTSAGPSDPAAAPGKSVQPGTANSLLTDQNSTDGIPLSSTVLPVANLNSSAQTASSGSVQPAANPQHHLNAAWLSVVVIIFLLAALLLRQTAHSAKNTTHY